MLLSFKQTRNLGIGLLVLIIISLSWFAISNMKNTANSLEVIISKENPTLRTLEEISALTAETRRSFDIFIRTKRISLRDILVPLKRTIKESALLEEMIREDIKPKAMELQRRLKRFRIAVISYEEEERRDPASSTARVLVDSVQKTQRHVKQILHELNEKSGSKEDPLQESVFEKLESINRLFLEAKFTFSNYLKRERIYIRDIILPIDRVIKEYDTIEGLIGEDEKLILKDLKKNAIKFKNSILGYDEEEKRDPASSTGKVLKKLAKKSEATLRQTLASLTDKVNERITLTEKNLLEEAKITQNITMLGAIAGIALALLVSFLLARALARPIHQLVMGTERIADGDLAYRVKIRSMDEIGQLANSFNNMVENLEKTTVSKGYVDNIIKSMVDLLIVVEPNGKIRTVNKAAIDLLNYSEEELIGSNIRLMFEEEEEEEEGRIFRTRGLKEIIKLGAVSNYEVNFKTKDGSIIPISLSGAVMQDDNDQIVGIVVIAKDFTVHKKAENAISAINQQLQANEQQLRASNQQLLSNEQQLKAAVNRAEKLAKAKSDFLANMSHEIRTPMNSIVGFNDLLMKTQLDEVQRNYLSTVRSSGDLLLGIIDDILDISKLESGQINLEIIDFNLENLIFDVFKMIVARMKDKPFDTYVDIAKDVPLNVKSDPTRLKQVLVNLLGNAVKFTSQGEIGLIVSVENHKDSDENYLLRFVVKDTGIGIPKDKLDTIFQSFTQADETTTRKFGGTGLGLSISKAIVEMMGGEIWAESEKGKGSEFIFTLALDKGNTIDQSVLPQDKITELKGYKVFIVDDNAMSRKIMNKCCEEMELDVVGISDSPHSALHKLDKLITSKGIIPDLILCDIMMDGMNGSELVEKIKTNNEFKDVKCIAVMADLSVESSRQATSDLFDAYLTKPISLTEMVSVLKNVVNIKNETFKKEETDIKISCQGINVLVVEDNMTNQMLIQAYFDQLKCEGEYANNGQEAIDMLKADNKYDLCLMDLQMPVLGGIEATEIIRKEISKDFPIIALTAAVLNEDREMAEKVGINDFLTKPIEIETLREVILHFGKK